MDIQETVLAIEQVKRNREEAGHIWLSGFHNIIEDSTLDYGKICSYVGEKLLGYPPFTKYYSSVQVLSLMKSLISDMKSPFKMSSIDFSDLLEDPSLAAEEIRKKAAETDLFYVHLPVDERYHLEFPMSKTKEDCRFIYTTCDICEGLEEHGFPELFIRQSVYFKSDPPSMYDNRISVNHQSPELIEGSYLALEDFIKECRKE
jgi:hypothetical protein